MRHSLSTVMENIGRVAGTFIGLTIDLFGLASTLTPSDQDFFQEEFLTGLGTTIFVAIPTLFIGSKLSKKYAESPKKELSSAFLLYCSFAVLTFVLDKLIEATYESSLGAVNLPMMIAGGTSACVITSLGVLTREPTPRVLVAISQCSLRFFQNCLPGSNHGGDNADHDVQNAHSGLGSKSLVNYATIS